MSSRTPPKRSKRRSGGEDFNSPKVSIRMSFLDHLFGRRKEQPPPTAVRLRGGVPALTYAVPASKAWAEWQRRRTVASKTGLWPLILGGELPAQPWDTGSETPAEILSKAISLSAGEILSGRLQYHV